MKKLCPVILLVLSISGLASLTWAHAAQPSLKVDWPAGWEYQPPVARGSIAYFQARQRNGGLTVQQLAIRLIPATNTSRPVDSESIRHLVVSLRSAASDMRAAVGDIHPLSTAGYYFSLVKHGSGIDVHRIEGVLMRDGYLLHFTLSTKNADASEMFVALGSISIQ